MKICYQDNYPFVGYPIGSKELFDVLATKSTVWEYEDEYRILYNPSSIPPGDYEDQSAVLAPDAVSSVYLGARISDDHKQQILDMIHRGPFQPNVLKAKISNNSFSLEFEKL